MRKFVLLLLSGAIFGACSDKQAQPVLVTDVVMPPETWVFNPGDGVTVSAEGFEADDEIMLEIYWEEGAEGFAPNGSAKGVWGIVTSRTATSLTFLAPGHYPASTTRVLLFRQGFLMPLGTIHVADGVPKTGALYGITGFDTDETAIDRIDPQTGAVTRVETLGVGQTLSCVVNAFGTGCLYGISENGEEALFDLTMDYYRSSGINGLLLAGAISNAETAFLREESERLLLVPQTLTRMNVNATMWILPDGVEPEMLERCPFVRISDVLLLAVRHADGTRSPLVLALYGRTGLGAAVEADAMIPFWTVSDAAAEPDKMVQVGGYALSKDGRTQLRLFSPVGNGSLGETLAEFKGTVLSVAQYVSDNGSLEIYLLCEADGVRRIHVYDALKKTQRTLPGEFGCSQIVAAK